LGNLTLRSFGLIWIAILLGSFGQIFLKKGLGHTELGGVSIVDTFLHVLRAMMQPYVLLGLGSYIVSTLFWMMILSRVRLSVAYPLISMSYPIVVFLSATVLHESVRWSFAVAGLAFISLGVSFIGLGLGRAQEARG
jgi:drug/metabolite transporter (DMT)-like permease